MSPTESTPSPTRLDLPSAGGRTLAAYRWDPEGEPTVVVQLSHGMGEHALRYAALAGALTARGWVVHAADHRGHGASIVDGEEPARSARRVGVSSWPTWAGWARSRARPTPGSRSCSSGTAWARSRPSSSCSTTAGTWTRWC